jgi:plasmid stabilization system protein ParE
MAIAIVWSITALQELSAIRQYLSQHASPEAATRVSQEIVHATRRLRVFPDSGRIVPEYARADLRELIVAPYRVIYRRTYEAAEIAHIVHTRRNLRKKEFRDLRR